MIKKERPIFAADIIREFLKSNNYEGLYKDGCHGCEANHVLTCRLDDGPNCKAGVKVSWPTCENSCGENIDIKEKPNGVCWCVVPPPEVGVNYG